MKTQRNRTNKEWLDALTGELGHQEQEYAFQDLAKYSYMVAINNLRRRSNNLASLRRYSDDELSAVAEELVQTAMEKMVSDNFAVLNKFSDIGSFLGWASQVVNNLCSSEMRRTYWRCSEPLEPKHLNLAAQHRMPDHLAVHVAIQDVLASCLEKLPERYRYALTEFVLEGKNANDVGAALGISPNAAYILVHRAKEMMRRYLEQAGVMS